jgi:WhiB family transcriptional regulator, redox-sensing transcriptional regulator
MTTTRGRADWRTAGACAQADPDLFFPISSAGRALVQIAKAKAICAACPVRQPCLEFALEHDLVHGIWGGTTPAERQAWRMAPGPPRSLSAPARHDLLRLSQPGRVQTDSWSGEYVLTARNGSPEIHRTAHVLHVDDDVVTARVRSQANAPLCWTP